MRESCPFEILRNSNFWIFYRSGYVVQINSSWYRLVYLKDFNVANNLLPFSSKFVKNFLLKQKSELLIFKQ